MKIPRSLLVFSFAATAFLTTGCDDRRHVARVPPPPPPPMAGVHDDRVARIAGENGMRDGREAGRRDAEARRPYEPRRNPMFKSYPGWTPEMGARGIYRDFYQNAFLQGYDRGYRNHD